MQKIDKRYEYKVYDGGTYVGLLQNVTSEFTYSQSINTAGSQLIIDIGETADNIEQPVQDIETELGLDLETEDNQPLQTERAEDVVGDNGKLIKNNNTVLVYEYSEDHKNGELVFSGYISKWKDTYGGNDSIQITVLSEGQDLNQWIIPGGDAYDSDQVQDQTNSDFGFWEARRYGQSFTTGIGVTNVGKITLRVFRGSAASRNMTVKVWEEPSDATIGGTPLASKSLLVTSTTPVDTDFIFDIPATTAPLTTYFFTLETPDVASVSGDSTTWGAFDSYSPANYADGTMFRSISGAAWTVESSESMWFKTYMKEESTERLYVNRDPSYILNDIFDEYGGAVTPNEVFPNTGITVPEYTFKLNTVLEGIRAVGTLAPANWYWYVDPADNVLYFDETNTEADIKLTKGRHIEQLDLEATKENVVNKVYFTGGDDGTGDNVFVVVTNDSSLDRLGIARLSDNNVNGSDGAETARIIAQNYLDRNDEQTYETSVTINAETIDITQFKLGQMIGFNGFGTYVDGILLQVVGIDRKPDQITLRLGTLPVRASEKVEQLQKDITSVQVAENPNVPS